MKARRGRGGTNFERGSALLIVFVFAAMIAIMLYMELPVAAFEAKRQKEQLLVDRGNEYAHAVKLFVRKFGMYPATIDQLENTNRMRFLRHRFKDPFTGKDDWRLLHAGPGGMLIDSKVKPAGGLTGLSPNAPGSNLGGSNPGGSNASSGFGSSNSTSSSTGTFGASSSTFGSSNTNDTVVPALPQRSPAVSASGGPSVASSAGDNGVTPASNDQSPTAPLLAPGQTDQMAGTAQNAEGTQPANTSGNAQAADNGAAGAPPNAGANANQNATDTMRNLLNGPPGTGNPAIGAPLAGSNVGGRPMGQVSGGGIAGVASHAKGASIKTVNDQTDYSLWEFYYDPSKDATRGMPGVQPAGAQQQGAQQQGIQQSGGANSTFGAQSGFNQQTTQTPPSATSSSNAGTQPPQQ